MLRPKFLWPYSQIDWVRVYQYKDMLDIGCDTEKFPSQVGAVHVKASLTAVARSTRRTACACALRNGHCNTPYSRRNLTTPYRKAPSFTACCPAVQQYIMSRVNDYNITLEGWEDFVGNSSVMGPTMQVSHAPGSPAAQRHQPAQAPCPSHHPLLVC